jgi:phosphoribosylaminoimidazolecarboxamide formyltransferase/IMP cyclohydrolase
MEKLALLSVTDKSGLIEFAKFLTGTGYTLLSTGGTKSHLESAGLKVVGVSDYTGSPEILDGRVKTLHPKVHGGLLARLSNPTDLKELAQIGAAPIPIVVVNLYPFLSKIAAVEGNPNYESLVEFIDIGGPAMLRASAKNFAHVTVITNPSDYKTVEAELKDKKETSLETRRTLAAKVFKLTAEYDLAVSNYLALDEKVLAEDGTRKICTPVEGFVLERTQELRYGENPHQEASLYSKPGHQPFWKQLQGKELSYNNLVDLEAALELVLEIETGPGEQAAVIIKHTNPCGSAIRGNLYDAFVAARACDPISAFGGIIAVTAPIDKKLAETILEGFVEVIISPLEKGSAYSPEALELFKSKKNIRLLEVDFEKARKWKSSKRVITKNFLDQILIQQADSGIVGLSGMTVACEGNAKYETIKNDLNFAWRVSKHVKSNAIVLVKGLQAIGVGAGQMSRLDSARIAIERAKTHGFDPAGSVAASDAFLPFPDTLEVLNDAGVVALVQPGGSVKDDVVTEVAKKRGVTMVLTGERHFRH